MTTPARPRLTDPADVHEWLRVAGVRLQEARELMLANTSSVGSAYLAGYAVECSLKAYLMNEGKPRPTYGGEGHNLRALWSSCDLVLRDLNDTSGSKNYFMSDWSTDLRYQVSRNTDILDSEIINGAGRVLSRITNLIRRRSQRRFRR